jgi:hypothetical protein
MAEGACSSCSWVVVAAAEEAAKGQAEVGFVARVGDEVDEVVPLERLVQDPDQGKLAALTWILQDRKASLHS